MSAFAKALWQDSPVQIDLRNAALRVLGTTLLALGGVGLLLPLVPTTALWMLAACCYAKSAPEVAERLFAHPGIGRDLRDWAEHRVMSRKVKLLAIGGLSTNFATCLWIADASTGAMIAWAVALLGIAAYVAARPERPDQGKLCRELGAACLD